MRAPGLQRGANSTLDLEPEHDLRGAVGRDLDHGTRLPELASCPRREIVAPRREGRENPDRPLLEPTRAVRYGRPLGRCVDPELQPIRRLEALELVRSDWENESRAHGEGRPRRRYYELTAAGKRRLTEAEARFHAVGRLFPRRSST